MNWLEVLANFLVKTEPELLTIYAQFLPRIEWLGKSNFIWFAAYVGGLWLISRGDFWLSVCSTI